MSKSTKNKVQLCLIWNVVDVSKIFIFSLMGINYIHILRFSKKKNKIFCFINKMDV